MSDSPFETPEFKRLKAEWDKKLKDSGFEDIEREDGSLQDDGSQYVRDNLDQAQIDAAAAYFARARAYANQGRFPRGERRIWAAHSEGKSIRAIASDTGWSRSAVQRLIDRHRGPAGLAKRDKSPQVEAPAPCQKKPNST